MSDTIRARLNKIPKTDSGRANWQAWFGFDGPEVIAGLLEELATERSAREAAEEKAADFDKWYGVAKELAGKLEAVEAELATERSARDGCGVHPGVLRGTPCGHCQVARFEELQEKAADLAARLLRLCETS